MAEDITAKGNLGRFVSIRPNSGALAEVQGRRAGGAAAWGAGAAAGYCICQRLAGCSRTSAVDRVVKRYAYLRRRHPELQGTVFHSTRKWFITQCERTGVPEHFTATLVGHHSARSANKLTYGLYSAGISGAQKRQIVEGVRVPEG